MTKALLITALATTFVLAGCNKTAETTTTQQPETMVQTNEQSDAQLIGEANQIANAMRNNEKLTCLITRTEDSQTIEYFVHGQKMRVNGIPENSDSNEVAYVVNDGDFYYTWTEPKNEGFKIAAPSEAEIQQMQNKYQNMMPSSPDFSNPDTVDDYEKRGYTMTCDGGNFQDDVFTPPSNVTFQDMNQVMNNAIDEAAQGMSEEEQQQVKDLMQQYGGQ